MSAPDDDTEKEHEATEQKLDEARRKGDVPRPRDLFAAAGFAGLLLAAIGQGPAALVSFGEVGSVLFEQADRLAPLVLGSAGAPFGALMMQLAQPLLLMMGLPMLATLGILAVSRSLIFTPDNLMPKLSRISPLATARQKFGRAGLFEFFKSLAKLIIVSVVLAVFLISRSENILASVRLGAGAAAGLLMQLVVEFLALIVVMQVVIGGLDFLWQVQEHRRRNRMSRQELLDQLKQNEGDPHLKAERRQRGVDIATNRMLDEVARADVVVVNPTHYAVALRWDRASGRAPVCVAKGVDEIAARIRARAAEAGVPVHRDPPTARALHGSVEVGDVIRPEHYRAVAAAIRFAETMRQRARARGAPTKTAPGVPPSDQRRP